MPEISPVYTEDELQLRAMLTCKPFAVQKLPLPVKDLEYRLPLRSRLRFR